MLLYRLLYPCTAGLRMTGLVGKLHNCIRQKEYTHGTCLMKGLQGRTLQAILIRALYVGYVICTKLA